MRIESSITKILASLPEPPPYYRHHNGVPTSLTIEGKIVATYLEAHRVSFDKAMLVLGLHGFTPESFAELRERSSLNTNFDLNVRHMEREAAIASGKWNPSLIRPITRS